MIEALKDYPVIIEESVRWGDMDAFDHVNNTVFFQYFEGARIAYFARIGFGHPRPDAPVGPILSATACRFRRPLRYPDKLKVGVCVNELGADRFHMEYVIWSEAQQAIAAEGTGTVVSYDYARGAKAPLPEPVRQAILGLESRLQKQP